MVYNRFALLVEFYSLCLFFVLCIGKTCSVCFWLCSFCLQKLDTLCSGFLRLPFINFIVILAILYDVISLLLVGYILVLMLYSVLFSFGLWVWWIIGFCRFSVVLWCCIALGVYDLDCDMCSVLNCECCMFRFTFLGCNFVFVLELIGVLRFVVRILYYVCMDYYIRFGLLVSVLIGRFGFRSWCRANIVVTLGM